MSDLYLLARHVVNKILVKLLIILEIGSTITNPKLEKLSVVTWKMLSKHFLQPDHKGFTKHRVLNRQTENATG